MSFSFAGYYFYKYKKFLNHEYRDYSFNIDLKFGKLYVTRNLFTLPGKYLPIDLSLKYIEPHTVQGQLLHLNTGLPIGIKTNYHVFLEYDSLYEKYKLEDSNGFLHVFELADNSTVLYFDRNGSGLMMELLNGGYKVFDDYGNYQTFDSNGRLILIHQQIANNHAATLSISYVANDPSNSLRIYSITDSYGKTIYFSYNTNAVNISYNNNTVISISFDNNKNLTGLTKNIGDNHIINELFDCDPLLREIVFDDGNTFSFYYYNDKVSSLDSSINHRYYAIDYFNNEDKATVKDSGGVKTTYDFSQEQSVNQLSYGNSNLSYLTVSSEHLSCLVKEATDNQILRFILDDSGQNPSYYYDMPYNETAYQTPISSNSSLESKKAYLFCVRISSTMAVDDLFTVELNDADDNLLARLVFQRGTTFLAAPVGIKESTLRQFYLRFSKNYYNSALIIEAKIVPLIGSFEMLCSNVSTNEPVFYYGDTSYYLLSNGNGVYLNGFSSLYDYSLYMSDYLTNERLLYISDSTSHYWFNNLTELADNISSMQIAMTQYLNMSWSSNPKFIKHSYMYPAPDALFYKISGKDDSSLRVTKISHDSGSFPTGHSSYHYEEEITEYLAFASGHTSLCDYDVNYLLKKITNGDGVTKDYDYDTNGNLLEEETSNNSNSETISENFTYDTSDNTTSNSKLVGSAISTTAYNYGASGKHTDTDFPNQLNEAHLFDAITEEREKSVKFTISASVYINQSNNYIAEDSYSLSTGGNTNLINSYCGEVCEVKYNNSQILEIEYVPNVHQDVVMNYRYYYRYANGYEYYDEYDNFRKLISNDGVIYDYDDFDNVTSISDQFLQDIDPNNNPYITYEYDYFNQLVATDVDYNGLSGTYAYDKYHRLTSESNTEYTISYTYYSLRNLEKTIKQSFISRDPFTAIVNDEVDIYSRLVERSVTFENTGFKKLIEYCHSSVDVNQTNNNVYKVKYYEKVNNLYLMYRNDVYSYDSMGNIMTITATIGNDTYLRKHRYDKYSRLTIEVNKFFDRTYTYEYDDNGNITSKTEYPYTELIPSPGDALATHTYTYDSNKPNVLMVYDDERFAYDNYGNPIVYRNHAITWTRGTLLSTYKVSNRVTIGFKYDGFKNRVLKTKNGVAFIHYNYLNNVLISEERTNLSSPIIYLYSHVGVIGFIYEIDTYFYEKNIQQDVIAIRNSNNQIVARYIYDAWGNHRVLTANGVVDTSSSSIGNINPFRYRSYYYDTNLKMYWLTSRYYDPEIARFISPDEWSYLDYKKIHSLNLYAYSRNNPVMYCDPSGHFPLAFLIGLFVIVISMSFILFSDTASEDAIEIPQGKLGQDYFEHTLSDGVIVQFSFKDNYVDYAENSLKVYNSYKMNRKQINEFLKWLRDENGYSTINVDRIRSEWVWHNIGYVFNIKPLSTRSVDAFFDSDDVNHGIFSWIINTLQWW